MFGAVYIGTIEKPKNHYHETFLPYFCLALKNTVCNFYWFWLDYQTLIWIIYKIYKTIFTFFSSSRRTSRKNIFFDNKKIDKSNFYKNKRLFKIDDIDANKILVSKKEPYGKKKFHLNTLLGMMIMMRLDHYVQSFLKWLDKLNALLVIRQYLSVLLIKSN